MGEIVRFTPKRVVVRERYKGGTMSQWDCQRTPEQVCLLDGAVTAIEVSTPANAWREDERYPFSYWKYEVANDHTRLGYVEWLAHKQEEGPHEE